MDNYNWNPSKKFNKAVLFLPQDIWSSSQVIFLLSDLICFFKWLIFTSEILCLLANFASKLFNFTRKNVMNIAMKIAQNGTIFFILIDMFLVNGDFQRIILKGKCIMKVLLFMWTQRELKGCNNFTWFLLHPYPYHEGYPQWATWVTCISGWTYMCSNTYYRLL